MSGKTNNSGSDRTTLGAEEMAPEQHGGSTQSAGAEPSRQEQPSRDYLDGFLFERPGQPGTNSAPTADSPAQGNASLEERVIQALRAIYDPEIPVNIYDLGLIYGVETDAEARVTVTMTLTTPHCPVAEIMPGEVEQRVGAVEGVSEARVDLVWDPPWDPSRMTEEAQLELGFI